MKNNEAGDILALIRRRRRFVALNVGIITLVALVVSLLLPKWYSAKAVLLPPAEEETSFSMSQILPRGLGGIKLPGAPSLSDVFVSVLKSRSVGDRLIARFDLVRRYRLGDAEKALRELQDHTRLLVGDEGTISIAVEDRDPKTAAAMANAYVEELDNFNRLTRTSSARRTREFIEERIRVVQQDLAAAENSLSSYQQRKNIALMSPEARGQAEIGANIMAQKLALEVKLNVLRRSLVESSEEVRRVREELSAVERQLGAMPQAGVATMRLWRDLKVQEQLYELLTAQLEEARIRETRDTPTVQVLDPAVPPLHKSRPKRAVVVLAGLLLGCVGSVGYLLHMERRSS
ncbi:MAG TPA: GNVR domain-containing protein [Candidatus Limnocylindrales bacterium]|nr:GNVR domain-containing protein [Candidatus Limnocylindrales bacterium]